MGKIRSDQSVQPSSFPSRDNLAHKSVNKLPPIQRGIITRVYYVDDPLNPTGNAGNPHVVYDVIMISGPFQGQIATNVRPGSSVASQYNYEETNYRASSKPFSGPNRVDLTEQDGDCVLIAFVDDTLNSGVIIGGTTHPLDKDNTGSTAAEGPRKIAEYNGVQTLIDNQGQYILSRFGGSLGSGYFTPNEDTNIEAQIKLYQDAISRKVTNGAIVEVMDGDSEVMTITFQSGMVVTLDGANDTVTIKTAGGATLKIQDGKVGLGTASVELVDIVSQLLQLLVTDLGNLGLPLVNSPQYAALKTQLDTIKGGV